MQDETIEPVTQDQLVTKLHGLGYEDVTKRLIADWRRHELLPPFDVVGGGQGQGHGRKPNSWTDGELVLDQTLWVRELLQIYRSVESIRLPLWMLGYPIPFKHVREALGGPLSEITDAIAEAIKNESRASGEIEDLIEEASYNHVEEMRRAGAAALQIPQHSLEAFFNVFLNQGYDLNDGGFEAGAEELKDYESAMQERHAAALAAEGLNDAHTVQQHSSLLSLLDRAPFIKKYLSLHQLKRAVDECTDDDLCAVEHDLYLLREIALLARRVITILTHDLPAEYQPSRADILRPIFGGGGLLVLADLSMRRNGLSQMINHFLPAALREFQEKFTDEVEQELLEASKVIPDVMETCVPIVIDGFLKEIQTEQPEQNGTREGA